MFDEVEQDSEMMDWLKGLVDESDNWEAVGRAQVVLELLLVSDKPMPLY
jgi:hypothetical protein